MFIIDCKWKFVAFFHVSATMCFCVAVILLEGGTEFDLQTLNQIADGQQVKRLACCRMYFFRLISAILSSGAACMAISVIIAIYSVFIQFYCS